MIYKLGELFCGPGGVAWGAINADIGNSEYGIVHQWANDYDADTCDTYRRKHMSSNSRDRLPMKISGISIWVTFLISML